MIWIRIDNRLIHGQVIESWLPNLAAKLLIVANDELSADPMQQEIMSLAIPQSVNVEFTSIADMEQVCVKSRKGDEAVLVLVSSCADAKRLYEQGLMYTVLNIGNVHYKPGKKQISPSVALSNDDESCLRFLASKNVELDFRCVPNDRTQVDF
ncbi:MAG: PTS sugar transporter subunit IIB [Desulfovibrio sp.]